MLKAFHLRRSLNKRSQIIQLAGVLYILLFVVSVSNIDCFQFAMK